VLPQGVALHADLAFHVLQELKHRELVVHRATELEHPQSCRRRPQLDGTGISRPAEGTARHGARAGAGPGADDGARVAQPVLARQCHTGSLRDAHEASLVAPALFPGDLLR
jgi:hypothetical protein